MPSLERDVNRLLGLIVDADAIIVGVGSGMSSAAGFNHFLDTRNGRPLERST